MSFFALLLFTEASFEATRRHSLENVSESVIVRSLQEVRGPMQGCTPCAPWPYPKLV